MKKIVFLVLILIGYSAALVVKDKANQKEKMKDIPTLYTLWEKNGTPVRVASVVKGSLVDTVIITGNSNNGVITCFVSPDVAQKIRVNSDAEVVQDEKSYTGFVESVTRKPQLLSGLHEVKIKFVKGKPSSKSALVHVEVGRLLNANIVTRDAVSIRGGNPHLFVVEEGTLKKKDVQIIGRNNNFYALGNQIKLGDQIVVSDQRYLVEGSRALVIE